MATLKRYKQKLFNWCEEECQAIEYTGDNIHEICKAFPTIEIHAHSHQEGWILVGTEGTVNAVVRPGDFVVHCTYKASNGEWFTSPIDFLAAATEYESDYDIWSRTPTSSSITPMRDAWVAMQKAQEEVSITKEADDSICKFAKQYNIDYQLCRTVLKKCKQHYNEGEPAGETIRCLTLAFRQKSILLDSDAFVKFNFLLDKWVEKHGTKEVMPIGNRYEHTSKLPLLNEMRVYGQTTLRDFFENCVLLRDNAIDFISDSAISRYCEDNGVYLTEFGVVQFNGEI